MAGRSSEGASADQPGGCDWTRVVLLIIGIAWLPVVVTYVPWAWRIGRKALAGTQFTVSAWTLANPFLIVILVPLGLALLWRRQEGLAATMLLIPAASWTLHEILMQRLFILEEPVPRLMWIAVLSLVTLVAVGGCASWRAIRR